VKVMGGSPGRADSRQCPEGGVILSRAVGCKREPFGTLRRGRDGDHGDEAGGGMSRSVRVALFDVDGTLVDTNYLHAVTWWEAFTQAGY